MKVGPVSESSEETSESSNGKFRVYPERWIVLATTVTLAVSNIMQWMSYSALIQETNLFFCGDADCSASFYSNQIYQVIAALVCISGMYVATRLGILRTLRICAFFNMTGSFIRLASSVPLIESFTYRTAVMLFGTTIAACSQMYFVIASKIAESWFFPRHRASANVACMNSVPLGAVFGAFLPSLIIPTDLKHQIVDTWHFFVLNSIICVTTVIPLILSFCIRRSSPPTPPSNTCQNEEEVEVMSAVWKSLKNWQFLVQIVVFVINFSTVMGIIFISEHLNFEGYDLKGYPVAIAMLSGMLAAYLVGVYIDRTRKFKQVVIANCVVSTVTLVVFRVFITKSYSNWIDAVIVCVLCSILMSTSAIHIPIGCELGVETTYPIHENISTGLLNAFGQIWLFLFFFILYGFEKLSTWTLAIDFWLVTSIIMSGFAILFLRPVYNRMNMEK